MSSYMAVNKIKDLQKETMNVSNTKYGKQNIVFQAFEIYNNLDETQRNKFVINRLLKLCSENNHHLNKILEISDDIVKIKDINFFSLLKCCKKLLKIDINATMKLINHIRISIIDNDNDVYVKTALITIYSQCKDVPNAIKMFDSISPKKKDIVSIGALMTCFIDNAEYEKAILLHEKYKGQHDDISDLLFIKACTQIGDYDKGKELINSTIKDINSHNIEFINTLINFYGKSGDINKAFNIFNNVPRKKRTIMSINAMMNAYNNNDEYNKALNLFNDTKKDSNICMSGHSFVIALCAAGYLVSPYQGSKIIDDLYKTNNIHILQSLEVQSSIISMHAKCSNFEAAINIFNDMDINKLIKEDKNGVLYLFGAIMDCYAKIGNIDKVLSLYNTLKKDKQIKITKSIYCTVLNACSHSGLINEASSIFEEIKCKYKENNIHNIHPHIITAMIDCFGRKNCLDEAENLYKTYAQQNVNMYHKHKLQMLLSLLSSCRIDGDPVRSQRIFNMMGNIANKYETDTDLDSAMHILLRNIYGKYKDFDKVNEIQKIMKEKGLKKKPGTSWIEINGKTHTFTVNDKSHPMYNEIAKEREIIKKELQCHGHIYDDSVITRELNEDENIEDHLCGHSEKSALIYGLIMSAPQTPLVIAKNLRVCKDCHAAIALISKIRNRKIKVRDKNRWHIFENGKCSCNDYF